MVLGRYRAQAEGATDTRVLAPPARGATRFYRITKRAISDSYLKLRSRDFIRADIPGAGTRGYTDKSGCRATPNAAHVSRPRQTQRTLNGHVPRMVSRAGPRVLKN